MPVTISVASGKGGVGKSVVSSNLAILLARSGRRVVLADMDVGGANLHILLGLFNPEISLSAFLNRRVDRLEKVLIDVPMTDRLKLIAGAGGTLATANPSYQAKQKLLRHLRQLDCDVVILDIGAGTNYHALDFFLAADHTLVVSTPEPTATLDVYKFIKLAAIRKVLSVFVTKSRIAAELAKRDFTSVKQILELTEETPDPEGRRLAENVVNAFRPLLVLNRTGRPGSRINTAQLRKVLKEYVGSDLEVLGDIPQDDHVEDAVRTYLPVVDGAPDSKAARALDTIAQRLLDRLPEPTAKQAPTVEPVEKETETETASVEEPDVTADEPAAADHAPDTAVAAQAMDEETPDTGEVQTMDEATPDTAQDPAARPDEPQEVPAATLPPDPGDSTPESAAGGDQDRSAVLGEPETAEPEPQQEVKSAWEAIASGWAEATSGEAAEPDETPSGETTPQGDMTSWDKLNQQMSGPQEEDAHRRHDATDDEAEAGEAPPAPMRWTG